jgi:hypothetical protein
MCPMSKQDLHYQTKSVQGWPKVALQIHQQDAFGRMGIVGYGFAHIPCTPGHSEVWVPCWRPIGTNEEELRAFFLNEFPVLLDEDVVYHKAAFRNRLVTAPSGSVCLDITVVTRHFGEHSADAAF